MTVLDDLSTGHADAVPSGARFVEASLHDSGPVLADVRPEAVLHFAAKSLVGVSQQQPEDYRHTNVGGSLALLEAMRGADCRRIVFSSTAATYGEPESVPIREDAPTRPTNTYGASKLAVAHMLTSYAVAHGFAAVSLRDCATSQASRTIPARSVCFGAQPSSARMRSLEATNWAGSPARRAPTTTGTGCPVTSRAASTTSCTEKPVPFPRL